MVMKQLCSASASPTELTASDGDKPAGSAKHKDRLTLLFITNI